MLPLLAACAHDATAPAVPDVRFANMALARPAAVMTYGDTAFLYYTGTVANNSGTPVGTGYSANEGHAVLQHWVTQGSTRRAAGGELFSPCHAGGALGVIPRGACNFEGAAVAVGPWSAGTGQLVSGSATLVVELKLQSSGGSETILDTHAFQIAVVVP
jgi:hypothetical protein